MLPESSSSDTDVGSLGRVLCDQMYAVERVTMKRDIVYALIWKDIDGIYSPEQEQDRKNSPSQIHGLPPFPVNRPTNSPRPHSVRPRRRLRSEAGYNCRLGETRSQGVDSLLLFFTTDGGPDSQLTHLYSLPGSRHGPVQSPHPEEVPSENCPSYLPLLHTPTIPGAHVYTLSHTLRRTRYRPDPSLSVFL